MGISVKKVDPAKENIRKIKKLVDEIILLKQQIILVDSEVEKINSDQFKDLDRLTCQNRRLKRKVKRIESVFGDKINERIEELEIICDKRIAEEKFMVELKMQHNPIAVKRELISEIQRLL